MKTICVILFVVFSVLKFGGFVAIGWWLLFAPLLVLAGLFILKVIIFLWVCFIVSKGKHIRIK